MKKSSSKKRGTYKGEIAVVYMKEGTDEHVLTLTQVKEELTSRKINFKMFAREILTEGSLDGFDIIMIVGGDGTFLKASHFVDEKQLMFGINSDPENKEGFFLNTKRKEFVKKLDLVLLGRAKTIKLARLEAELDGETLPLALNEVFIGDTKPYRVSYYTLRLKNITECHRTSGLIVSTASGTYAWAGSAGGKKLPLASRKFEIVAREPYIRRLNKQKIKTKILDEKNEVEIISDMRRGMVVIDSLSGEYPFNLGQCLKIKVSKNSLRMVI